MIPKSIFFKPLSKFLKNSKIIYLFLLFICLYTNSSANTYYVSSTDGNDSYSSAQAQNSATPWKSIAMVNSFFNRLVPGDIISFKSGDVFYGAIVVTRSGSSGNPIVLNSYGGGNAPLISGLTTVNSWTSLGNNIYQSYLSGMQNIPNLVVINGVPQQIGRYPNNRDNSDPYLYYKSFSNGTSITDNQSSSSTNWTGAEVVIRKLRWIMDRSKITSQSGGTIQYNYTNGYAGLPGFGYFIQNDPRTLDQFGEWYLNTSTKNLQMHFGGNQPSSYSVKVSTIDVLLNLGTNNFITVNNLAFEGGNVAGILGQWGNDITIQQCDLSQMGKDGILLQGSANTLIENTNLNYILNNGIFLDNSNVSNAVVRNCTIRNCAMIPGMGANGDGSYTGLSVYVNSTATVEYNTIENVGYNGIEFQGSNVTIRNNFINNVCNLKDDGGGIYTCGNTNTYSNRQIYNNIVINANGAPFGTSGKTPEAEGIYLDQGSSNIDIHDNSTAYMGRDGLMFNNIQNVNVYNNTVFDARWGVEFVRFASGKQVRNNQFTGNIIYPKTADQSTVYYKNWALNSPSSISIQQDLQSISTFDNNIYGAANPTGFGYFYSLSDGGAVQWAPFSLDAWKSSINKDNNSHTPSVTPSSVNDLRFEYNATTSTKTVSLDANYVGVDNTSYNGSITLQPYTSKILIKNGPSTVLPPISTLNTIAEIPPFDCSGGNTTVSVKGSGGIPPYNGIGNFSTNAGKGSLKISFPSSGSSLSTVLFAPIGNITAGKTYVLRFTTLGTTGNGQLNLFLRQFASPNNAIANSYNGITFGTSRVDHQYIFTPTVSDPNGRFDIEVIQNSGTTYIDNIAVFEATSTGSLISSNLFSSGQFESGITGINIWSSNNNQVAEWDTNGKINNTDYYTITDATGAKSTAGVTISQSLVPLVAAATAGSISSYGSSTNVTVSASGGTNPYTGTGTFTVSSGIYNYVVTDANGCTSTTNITVSQPAFVGGSGSGGNGSGENGLYASATAGAINCTGSSSIVTVSANGGNAPYTGIGIFNTGSSISNTISSKGSLKISFPTSVSTASTVMFAPVGTITAGKYYVLKFSTIGTSENGKLKLFVRQFGSPNDALASPFLDIPFGTSRIDHQYIFAPTVSDDNGRFDIEVMQNSGTTYIDNISFYESSYTGEVNGNNLFNSGQFETDIAAINIWSKNNNQVAEWDNTGIFVGSGYYNAGKGSLKISFPTSVSTASSVIFAPVGSITTGKNYVLRFSTLGTSGNGKLNVFLRQMGSPNNLIATSFTNISFGTSRVDHQFFFTPTISNANGRFDIEILQNSGTTYLDNIAFFEANPAGELISSNLFNLGQFENDISSVNIWSANNNQVAAWDGTAKISNTNYFTVTDASGVKSTVGVICNQPDIALSASGTTTTIGGSNTVTITATGGVAPYSGTGTKTVTAGSYNYVVTDANGCTSTASINVSQSGSKIAASGTNASTFNSLVIANSVIPLNISCFPNPSKLDFGLLIDGGTLERVKITVISTDGREVYQTSGTSRNTYKFGGNFLPGLYIIKVVQGTTMLMMKVVKG